MPQPGQAAGVNQVITVAQQSGGCTAPDFLHGMLLKKEVAPDTVFNIEAAAGDGEVNVRMQVELSAVHKKGAEEADLNRQLINRELLFLAISFTVARLALCQMAKRKVCHGGRL